MVATTFSGMGGMVPDTSFGVWNGIGGALVTTNALPSGMQGTQPVP